MEKPRESEAPEATPAVSGAPEAPGAADDAGDVEGASGPQVREVHEIGNRTYLVADVEPLDVTGVRTVAVGTSLFLIGALALLPAWGWMESTGREWWFWTCVAGFGLGLFGTWFCIRRARLMR